jgi:hypothetical protein
MPNSLHWWKWKLRCIYAQVLMQMSDNNARAHKTTRGSDVDLGCGRRHAPQVQERISPECDPPTANAYAIAMVWVYDNNSWPCQTFGGSGTSPSHSRGHAPRAQERTSPECDPLTANAYTQAIMRMDDNDDWPCQTARWSGLSPSHGHGFPPEQKNPERHVDRGEDFRDRLCHGISGRDT